MPLVIDTYNVLHTVGILPPDLAGIDVPGLIDLIQRSRYGEEKATLVCDGPPPDGSEIPGSKVRAPLVSREGNVTVRYAGKGGKADDLIEQIIRLSSAPRRLLVISSDHAVLRSGQKRRCRTKTSDEFLGELAADALRPSSSTAPAAPKPPGSMNQEQVDRWLRLFDVDDELVEEMAKEDAIQQNHRAPPAESSSTPDPPELRSDVLPEYLVKQAEHIWDQANAPRTPKEQGD